MKAGSSQLPCVCLLHCSSLPASSLSAWVCPASHYSFQTGESLFLGSLCFFNASPHFMFDPIWVFLFSLEGKLVSCVHVFVFVCTRACIVASEWAKQ